MDESLDKFGKLIINVLNDKQIDYFQGLLEGRWKSKESIELHDKLSKFNSAEKLVITDLIENVLINSMHDFLFIIQENNESENGLKIFMENENLADLSDGLHGEIYGDSGWIQRFSKYKSDKV